MKVEDLNFIAVSPKDRVRFHCCGCGNCCRNVYQSVPVETLDAFRIAKHLRDAGESIGCMDDFWRRYGEAALLDECGYFVYFLKTKGKDNSCIFLNDNRCSIHSVNPRACRLYPFAVDPETGKYLVSHDYEHHFKGGPVKARTWMKQRYSNEDREFLRLDYGAAQQIAQLMRGVADSDRVRAAMLFQLYKYSDYDLDKPFLAQFKNNQENLIHALKALIKK